MYSNYKVSHLVSYICNDTAIWEAYIKSLESFLKMKYTKQMTQENRQEIRYNEIGKVVAADICPISGILDDISNTGCKIHYSFPVVLDLENEYDVKIAPLHCSDSSPLHLLCKPQWVNEIEGNTYIGFKVLYSPDASRLADFIIHLKEINEDFLPDVD